MTETSRGPVRWASIKNPEDLRALITEVGVTGDFFIVKPNWFDPRPGSFTDPYILDLALTALPGKKLIIEGHSHSRTDQSRAITPDSMDANRDWLREQHQLFLERTGLAEVLAKHGVEFLNVTEEFWAGRVADAAAVRGLVESKFGPAEHQDFYGYVPRRLFELRGATLIDLARIKMSSPTSRDYSLTMKNLFGLVPYPNRFNYHDRLSESIVDINMVYRGLFDVVGLAEGIRKTVVYCERGRLGNAWSHFEVVKDLGIAVVGRNLVAVDVAIGMMFNQDLLKRTAVRIGEEKFGQVTPEDVGEPPLLLDLTEPDWLRPVEEQESIVTDGQLYSY